ncbi:MAG: LysE family transporter, partial [Rhodobacteraceae bacterium]|nr:LysE family transporter [Paracoccaceae bacterium]
MLTAAFAGFRLGLGLILAIGAQNAFVLRQGLRREHVFATCLFCALSDAILIAIGVSGFAAASLAAPWLAPLLRWGGVVFLAWYG